MVTILGYSFVNPSLYFRLTAKIISEQPAVNKNTHPIYFPISDAKKQVLFYNINIRTEQLTTISYG
jgi:hypothetical protein